MATTDAKAGGTAGAAGDKDVEIDDSLYSRQRYVLGDQAMKRMAVAHVLVSGMTGLGVEVAKNIALAGVKSLTVHDTAAASWLDVGSNFFLREADLGKNRASVCAPRLAELNSYVPVREATQALDASSLGFLDAFAVVILIDQPISVQTMVNEYCRARGIRFITSEVRGVFTWAFCDFGDSFDIHDTNGENELQVVLSSITSEEKGLATTFDNRLHGFSDGDTIVIHEVAGMPALNGTHHKITDVKPTSFRIGDTRNLGTYQHGGTATQVKQPITVSFRSLNESLRQPAIMFADLAKLDAPPQILLGMQALHSFMLAHNGEPPAPWDDTDAKELVSLAEKQNESAPESSKVDKPDTALLTHLAHTARGAFAPLAAFMGGVVAQEALKALTGKFTPLNQWLLIDATEVLPAGDAAEAVAAFQPTGSRIDAMRICLGAKMCERLASTQLFVVGAGAIGCELLKNFAMLNIATADPGMLTVTDNDVIEKSNLNRQFLFRKHNLEQPKSTAAAAAVKLMNPALRTTAHEYRVGSETENVYTDAFFEAQDCIVNALDNVAARLYVDSRCVANQRPLLESGTLGTKGHVQVIVPFLTESYGSSRDPPEKDVPFCTLKSFPSVIEHTIQWARTKFDKFFMDLPRLLEGLYDEGDLIDGLRNSPGVSVTNAKALLKFLEHRDADFDHCIATARQMFQTWFHDKIIQLLHVFPHDLKLKDGSPFWALPKRPPNPLTFDPSDPMHMQFILSTAVLRAKMQGIKFHTDMDKIRAVAAAAKVADFKPSANVKIETDESKSAEEAAKAETAQDDVDIDTTIAQLTKVKDAPRLPVKSDEFEKDDDTNFHVAWVNCVSNLRARNYGIAEVDALKTKLIAGKIIPAIATTTAAVSGLVTAELVKILAAAKLEAYKNCFMNLAVPLMAFSEPAPAEKIAITSELTTTLWDRWEVMGGKKMTLQEFMTEVETKYGVSVTGVFQDTSMVYLPMMPIHKKRLPKKLASLLTYDKEGGQRYVDLIISVADKEGEEKDCPPVRFWIKPKTAAPAAGPSP